MAEQQNDPAMLMVDSLETAALTKAQLAELLFEQIGLNKREAKEMVDAFFEQISQALVSGDEVKLSGFGNFQLRTKAPHYREDVEALEAGRAWLAGKASS